MSPSFRIEETGETVLVKPTGELQFWKDGDVLANSITLSSEQAAIEYAKARGWKEIQPV